MWSLEISGKNEHATRYKIKNENDYLTFRQVFNYWKSSSSFTDFYCNILKDIDYPAFFWEHPGLNEQHLDRTYEFILQNSRMLDARQVNENAFSKYIHKDVQAVEFFNLGKDARLVVPTKKGPSEIYKHLAVFIRNASAEQVHEFFKLIGETIFEQIKNEPMIWLNTAGQGVIWLHVRMDTRPKYYKTATYRNADFFS